MVGTRRSSRLQAKHEAETATQESEVDTPRASPVRTPARRSPGRSPGSTSKSPASATKRSPRGRTTPPRKAPAKKPDVAEDELTESEEERMTPTLESDESAQEIPLDIDGDSPVAEHSEEVEQVQTSAIASVNEKSDEEDEILMLGEVDEDEDESAGEDGAETETDDETSKRGQDGEEDISQYALLAASGLNLSLSSLTSSVATPAVKATEPALAAGRKLVPDQLDSGASLHASYFDFKGHKCNNGAQLRADRRAEEEKGVIRKQLDVVAHSTQQREESKKSSAGRKWFDMESEELTADARRDFALLRMRNYLDPKKFYKTSDHNKHLPKHFQMGVVIEGAHEFKSARLTKKQRQQTFTDEIMADDSIRQYTKRVFGQVQAARSGAGRKKKLKTKRAF